MMEFFGDVVIYGTFVFDAAWAFIFLASAGIGFFVYSAIGTVLLCMTVLLVFMGTPRRAMGQHNIPQTASIPGGHDTLPFPPLSFEPSKFFDFDSTLRQSSAFQQPTKPPQWDFSVPRFQSFHRRKAADYDSLYDSFRFDPSETWSAGCLRRTKREAGKICSDFRNFYSCDNVANIGIGYGVHAVISNTPMDQRVIGWYQQNVRSGGLDKLSANVKLFGEPEAIMLIAGVSILYYSDKITDRVRLFETPTGSGIGKFASQTSRAFLVGAPTLWFSQSLIGSGRPNFPNPSSRWQPFVHANGVSGHAFVGAMPFITLAQMSDNFWLKTTFYTCSTFTAWSRINDDTHYLSQCMLGWYLAYLSCRAVSKTEYRLLPRGLTVFPVMEPRTTGIGFVYQW
ncbi:MAG: phosphatase PAP2 family protein [Planctomycetaceae bacterium]|nr:phosphatase PAP2 family protein [Planctomycetaceae bacterium]